jgi:hypothetical protein
VDGAVRKKKKDLGNIPSARKNNEAINFKCPFLYYSYCCLLALQYAGLIPLDRAPAGVDEV